MPSNHGKKPPNPLYVPKSHGKKPPAPKPHKSSGKSSPATHGAVTVLAWSLVAVPVLGIVSAVGYVLHGHGII